MGWYKTKQMKILFDIGHPAHVHLFKNAIWQLKREGHDVIITVRDKDSALKLLEAYGFNYIFLGFHKKNLLDKAFEMLKRDIALFKVARDFDPDVMIGGVGNVYVAQVSRLLSKPSIIFDDTEHAHLEHLLCYPFSTVFCTPSCYKKNLGKKQIRYDGYHQFAYLHPKYFKPDHTVLETLGLKEDDKFIVLRFAAFNASHDSRSNDGMNDKIKLVNKLTEFGRVFIASEKPLEKELLKYNLIIQPDKLHSLLSYAQLYIGGGETMAIESAILGTPSIDVEAIKISSNKVVDISYFHGIADELINKYKLMFAFTDQDKALEKAIEILENKDSKKEWQIKREKLLNEKIDVTEYMLKLIRKYGQ